MGGVFTKAAIPDAQAMAAIPCSNAAILLSKAAMVGLLILVYEYPVALL